MDQTALSVQIALQRGKFTLVDLEDYNKLAKFTWHAATGRGYEYAKTSIKITPNKRKTTCMHRMLMGAKPDEFVDHKNGNTLDNRKANLRICTKLQNNINSRTRKDNLSGAKGVHWDSQRNRWMAKLVMNNKYLLRKRFIDKAEAIKAYQLAAKQYYGEFVHETVYG